MATIHRTTLLAFVALLAITAGAASAQDEDPKAYLSVSGFYAFNGYSQNNFFLGRTSDAAAVGGVSDKDEYGIQMLRLQLELGYGKNLKAVLRADFGQGIWGIDNSRQDGSTPGFSELFNSKDTNFGTHVDWAYIDATHPDWKLNLKLGRMKYALGNLLVLDQDSDGFQLARSFDNQARLRFGWAKMSEGADSLSDETAIGPGGQSTEDATLYLLDYETRKGEFSLNPFVAFYQDDGYEDGTAYLIDGLQYARPRFTPQTTQAVALGFGFKGKAGRWNLKGEVDYLTGDDDIDNATAGASQRLDVNNGDLEGYNLYLDAKTALGPGKLGFVFGMGSGDDDPMSGKGNINKIRTNGFFYVTEVWEDSVMPDEEGITPQGLGSPASRGYREFENTTLLQANYDWKINDKLNLFAAATWMRATEDILAWADVVDANGNGFIDPGDDFSAAARADDLGSEIDLRLHWKVIPGLVWVIRGGAFFPGDAAGHLVNGTARFDDTAYELRTTFKFTFGKLLIGGPGRGQ